MIRIVLVHVFVLLACCVGRASVVENTNIVFGELEAPIDPPQYNVELLDVNGVYALDCWLFTNLADSFSRAGQCLATDTAFFSVEAGDPLTPSSARSGSYPEFQEFTGNGDFYIGFAAGGGLDEESPIDAIGWMQFRRTSNVIEMLENVVSYSMPPAATPGIYVGTVNEVPEPVWSPGVILVVVAMVRLAQRRGEIGVSYVTRLLGFNLGSLD